MNTFLEDLELSTRTHNCLKKAGIDNLHDFMGLSDNDVRTMPNAGRIAANEVAEVQSYLKPEYDNRNLNAAVTEVNRIMGWINGSPSPRTALRINSDGYIEVWDRRLR